MELKGEIKVILDTQEGTSAAGKEWKKLTFVISNNDGYEGREQIFAFDIFGADKVDKFLQHNEVGKKVEVSYNIESKEYNGKYYTNLSAWKVLAIEGQVKEEDAEPPF